MSFLFKICILQNSKFSLTSKSLGTNIVTVKGVHCTPNTLCFFNKGIRLLYAFNNLSKTTGSSRTVTGRITNTADPDQSSFRHQNRVYTVSSSTLMIPADIELQLLLAAILLSITTLLDMLTQLL